MNSSALREILDRVETWPAEDQEELVRAALYIERRNSSDFTLSGDDWKIIDARLAAARLGAIASDEEMSAVFNKYRTA